MRCARPRTFDIDPRRGDGLNTRHCGDRERITAGRHVLEFVRAARIRCRRECVCFPADGNRSSAERRGGRDLSVRTAGKDRRRSEEPPTATRVARDSARERKGLARLSQRSYRIAEERAPRTVWRPPRKHEVCGAVNECIGTASADASCHDLDDAASGTAKRLLHAKSCQLRPRPESRDIGPTDKHAIGLPECRTHRPHRTRAREGWAARCQGQTTQQRKPGDCPHGITHGNGSIRAGPGVEPIPRTELPAFLAVGGRAPWTW